MEKDILDLFDASLGRLKFVRRFIRVLWNLWSEVKHLRSQVEILSDENTVALLKVKELEGAIKALDEALSAISDKPNKEKAKDFTSASGLMDRHYNAMNTATN